MVTLLQAGPVETLTQNVTYALPAMACWIQSDTVLEFSNIYDDDFVAVDAVTTGSVVASLFVKSTAADALVSLKYV